MIHARIGIALAFLAFVPLAGCAGGPDRVERRHGLGGSSLVYIEEFDSSRTQRVGAPQAASFGEITARVRARLLTKLREAGYQTRDGQGFIPADGILVRGSVDTVDGGPDGTFSISRERLHCTVSLWNGAVSRGTPAFDLKVTGTPDAPLGHSSGILGAADDAAEQIAEFIRKNP